LAIILTKPQRANNFDDIYQL